MCQVSGVGINESLEGEIHTKGWEFGRFKFGGSDIIILFDKHAKVKFNYDKVPKEDVNEKDKPRHYKFGETIGQVTMSWDE